MRKFFTALVVIPLGLIFIVFAVANRHFVTVSFDPFNSADPAIRGVDAAVRRDHRRSPFWGWRRAAWRPGSASATGAARRASMRRMPAGRGRRRPICGPRRRFPGPISSGFRRRPSTGSMGPQGETSRARRCRTRPVSPVPAGYGARKSVPERPCPCSSKFAACPRARRSTQRSRRAPTWWASCSFPRRRAISASRSRGNSAGRPRAAPPRWR